MKGEVQVAGWILWFIVVVSVLCITLIGIGNYHWSMLVSFQVAATWVLCFLLGSWALISIGGDDGR